MLAKNFALNNHFIFNPKTQVSMHPDIFVEPLNNYYDNYLRKLISTFFSDINKPGRYNK
jgi:hypothetical protein